MLMLFLLFIYNIIPRNESYIDSNKHNNEVERKEGHKVLF